MCKQTMVFVPGSISGINTADFISSYETMAKRADLTIEEACEMRYDIITAALANDDLPDDRREELKKELEVFGSTPDGEKGSDERSSWFKTWLAEVQKKAGGGGIGGLGGIGGGDPQINAQLLRLLATQRFGVGEPVDGRRVRAADADTLKAAVTAHPALTWDERIAAVANKEGTVQCEDTSDSTMQVQFPNDSVSAWLPTEVLEVLDDTPTGSAKSPAAATGGYEKESASPAPPP